MRSRVLLAPLLSAVLLLGACTGGEDPARPDAAASPPPTSSSSPSPDVQDRAATTRSGPKILLEARGTSRARVTRAIADLKEIGLWSPLTRRLYTLQLQTAPGLADLPDDGHLADAMLSAVIDEEGQGSFCSVRFYPAALARELGVLEDAYARGLFGPPPTRRQLWAVVLAHELAHCKNWDKGEPFAEKWEGKALEAVRAARLE